MDYVIATHHLEPQSIVSIRERRKQTDLPGFLKEPILPQVVAAPV